MMIMLAIPMWLREWVTKLTWCHTTEIVVPHMMPMQSPVMWLSNVEPLITMAGAEIISGITKITGMMLDKLLLTEVIELSDQL